LTPRSGGDHAKDQIRAQFGPAAHAYVTSPTHAAGADLARLVELAEPGPDDLALDVATGGGHVALALAPRVRSVVASDLTPAMLAAAEHFLGERGAANVTFREADAEALPFPDASFDLVTCRIAPHHFPRPDRFVAEAARVLRAGGRFALVDSTVPQGELGAAYNRFEALRDPTHVRSLTAAEWRALIGAAGLALRAEEHFPKRHDFAAWTDRAGLDEADRTALNRWLLDADPAFRDAFAVELSPDGVTVLGFTDEKTLFVAARPA